MQPGDVIGMNDDGRVVLARPGAPVREVDVGGTFLARTAGRYPDGSQWIGPDIVIVRPVVAALAPDQRDALTAVRDMCADDAQSLTMAGGRQADLGAYAGQIAARLSMILGEL